MTFPLPPFRIQFEEDVVEARRRTREMAEALGFETQQQTRLATGVSEIARNAFSYAGGGKVEFFLEGNTPPQIFSIRITDEGQGIQNIDRILDGTYRSPTGMGLGIIGTQRMMDQFRINTVIGKGTVVVLGKLLPRRAPLLTAESIPALLERISQQRPKTALDDFREQNQELLRTMDELRKRQEELSALNRELEDTNRGVVALYSELDEKADHLRRADEMKSRFLSNMSHEFRTPLNSIQALSRLLLDRTDGELTSEHELQVSYIRKSAESLSELVNDLLDIAKVEAGKVEIRPTEFEAANLFGALRGMLKPLLVGNSLRLIFEDPAEVPPIYSDEAKVSQILRNFVSNALKFTEAGEVRVSAKYHLASDSLQFDVQDTGIGIAREHQEHVFKEFTQLDSYLQRTVKGTGLGLPLSRKLAELLGGAVSVQSELGIGSTFSLRIPRIFGCGEGSSEASGEKREATGMAATGDPDRESVLLVEDHNETRLTYEKHLRLTNWHCVPARSVQEAEAALRHSVPAAIILDIRLQGEDAWDLLARLKSNHATRGIPVIVATNLDDQSKAMALGADEFLLKPVDGDKLQDVLRTLTRRGRRTILLVDDEEASRYLAKQLFNGVDARFIEAKEGAQALGILTADRPDLMVLDLAMTGMNGFQILETIHADAALKQIPVIVLTSSVLQPAETAFLSSRVIAILSKGELLKAETAGVVSKALLTAGLRGLNVPGELQ